MEQYQETYQDTQTQDPPIKRLYDGLYKTQRYSKSFDEFKAQYSTPEAIDKLYNGLEKSKSYSKGKDEFYKQYFSEVKKKEEPTPSASLGGELPLQKENKGEGLVDAELQPQEPITLGNVFDDANKSFSLRNTIKEVPNNDLRNNAPITLNVPDEDAINKSKEIDKQYLENGIDPQKVATLTQGLNFTQEQKDNLDYIAKTNPAYFNRHLQHISWTAPFMKEMRKRREEAKLENDPQKAVQIEKAISDVYKNGQILPYEQSREVTRNALRGIRTIFDNPEEQQNKFAENAEYNYGQQLIPIKKDGVWYEPNAELNRGKDVAKMFDSGINDVQRIGLNYLEDLHPEQYQSYKGLLVPYKDGDEKNIDLQVGRQEKLMRLEALGLNIKYKAALEEFYKARERGDVESQNTYKEVLDNTQKFSENLIEKYPLVKQLDVEKLAMEVNGRDDLPTTRFMYVLGSSVDKTLKGGWEIISYPFRSEENYQKHLLEVVGDTKQAENITYLPQKYQTIQSFDIEQSKEAKAKFAEINSQDISDEEKNKQIADYISQNKNTVTREGIEGGRTNITMASMLYGVSDIAANLAPYVALTALTGGGASASALRAFSSEFSAASLTMFNDELSAAAERGEANPFASALRHTFINSAAMAGAGTASKIRELAIGSKNPAIKAMIANMDDKAIEAAIKKETQNRFKNIYEVAKNKMVQSATSAAKITPAIQLGGVVNDAMDGKEFDVNEQVKHLGVETFKFTLFGLLTGGIRAMVKKEKPNDIQKYSMLEAGKNSEYFIKNIDTQLQEGKINAEQYNVLKSNIEIAKKVFDNTPMVDVKGKPLSDKKKRDLTFVKFNELRAAELLKKDIPQELREKTEIELQAAKEEAEKIQSGKGGGVGGDVEARYNERKKSIEDKLNQQLEDNKDRLDDIEDKGGTKTVRQKIYQEHTNEMVELEKWKMKEDLKNEKNDTNLSADKTKKSNDNLLTDDEIFDKLDFGDDKVFVDKLLARGTPKSDILRTRFGKDALDKEPSLRMNAERNRISDKIEAETDPLKKLAMLINPEAWEQTHSSLLGGDFGTHNHHATNQAKVPLQIVKGEQPQKRFYDDYINGLRKGGNNDAADYLESIYNKQQENGWGNAIEGSVWTTPKGNTSNGGQTFETGKPITVFHGTTQNFETFDAGKRGSATHDEDTQFGTFFSDTHDEANKYTKGNGRVIKAELNLKNPLVVDVQKIGGNKIEVIKKAIADGHDGIVFENILTGKNKETGEWNKHTEYIVFDNDAIKILEHNHSAETPTPKGNTSNVGVEEGSGGVRGDVGVLEDGNGNVMGKGESKIIEVSADGKKVKVDNVNGWHPIENFKVDRVKSTSNKLENLSEKDFDKLTPSQKVALYKEHGITKEDGSPITEKDIENSPLQYSYDFMASSDSGKWNSANSELESLVKDHRKAYSLYKMLIGDNFAGDNNTFKDIVDYINNKTDANIEYTDRMRRADETMSAEERQAAVDSYNKSAEGKTEDKVQKEKDILEEHGLADETEYSPHELVEKFPLKGVQKVIWDIIKPIVEKLGIKVKFSSSRITEGFDGSNNPMNGEILLRPSTLKNGRLGEVLVHEVVHSLTTKIISRVNSGVETGLTGKQVAAVKGLNKLYKSIEADNNLQNKYPVKDIFEFIAHLTNDTFVKELQSKDRNFIQKVVDFISDILGLSDANELAKKYLKDIIHDGTFLEKEGITVVSSDYAANVKGAEGLTPKQRLLEAIKNNSKTTAEKYHDLKSKGKENDFTKAVEQSTKETTKAETTSTTSNVGVEEGSGGVGGDLSKMNQSEFAQWIQDNKDYLHSIERESTSMAGKKITVKPFENQYYDLLTVRPEHREQFIKNKGVLSEVDFNEAKEYYKTLQKEEAKYSNSDSNPDWLQFNFGNTTNTEADGNRRKGYITISENSIDNFKGNISNLIAELNKALEGNYNGSFKIAQKLGTLKNQFDNLVIHGANAQEVQKALNIINKTLLENGVDNKISQIGIDGKNKKGDKTSHTRLLEEKIQNNELVKAVEQPTKETTKAGTTSTTSNVGVEEGSEGDVKWNNTGTEFKDNKFSKDGKTFSVKVGWNRFNRDLSISVLDENGKEVSVASFKQGEDGKFYSEGTGTTDGSFTEKDFRGKGLMKSVYDFVDKNYGEVKPSKNLTNDGLGFWESNRKQSLKETTKEETPISEEVKNEEITKLEEQRDAEIDEVLKPKLELEFIDNADIALNKQTGQDRVKVTKKGKSVTTKENFRDIQNDLKKMKSKLEALINCK